MNERAEGFLEGIGAATYLAMRNKGQSKRLLNESNITFRVQLLLGEDRVDRIKVESRSLLPLRFTESDMNILANIASASSCNKTSIIRRALAEFFARNGYLTEERKKWILP
jgi:hypothetical protein